MRSEKTCTLPLVKGIALLTSLGLAIFALEKGQAKTIQRVNQDFTAIDAYVSEMMHAWNIPGAALAIIQNGQVVHLQGFGDADSSGRRVTPQTPFEIGSCSKSFTALAVMQLVEQGKIELDAPVQRYLPWFRLADPQASTRITVRNLLNHASGISKNADKRTMINPGRATLEEQVRYLQNVRLTQPPGTVYQYSNQNYMALALIIEAVSGQSYEEYLRKNIFGPLEMQNSYTATFEASQTGLSEGHTWWFGLPLKSLEKPRPDMLGAGYLMVSAEDMAHYLAAQLNGGKYGNASVLSPQGIDLMHQRTQLANQDSEYGIGWVNNTVDGLVQIEHGGSSASYRCQMILLPERGLGVAVLINVSGMLAPPPEWYIGNGVKAMLLSGKPVPVTRAFQDMYLRWNGGFLLATGLLAWSVIGGSLTWRKKMQRHPPKNRQEVLKRVILPIAGDGLIALALLLGLPIALGFYVWRGMFTWQPDAAYWCLGTGLAMSIKCVYRFWIGKFKTGT